jgi:CRP-like cAMP-binding protein
VILVEKVLFLRHVPLFSRMSLSDLGRLAEIAEEVVYPAGRKIFREGEFGETLFLIVDGSVDITRAGEAIAHLGPRDYFGEMSILDGEPRSATAVAASDCALITIRREEFHRILAMNFDAALAVIKTLSRNLRAHVAVFGRAVPPAAGGPRA